jgi:hypothetical protein
MSKLIVNVTTGETIEKELSKADKDQQKIDEASIAEQETKKIELDAQRQAILDRLGLTVDEAKLLLG